MGLERVASCLLQGLALLIVNAAGDGLLGLAVRLVSEDPNLQRSSLRHCDGTQTFLNSLGQSFNLE